MKTWDVNKVREEFLTDVVGEPDPSDIREELHGDKNFLLVRATQYTTDVGSSKRTRLRYYNVKDFEALTEDDTTLDLTWMNSDDSFMINSTSDENDHVNRLTNVTVNIDNLTSSFINSRGKFELKIIKGNSKRGNFSQIIALKQYLEFNSTLNENSNIKSIEFKGFSSFMEKLLTRQIEKYGLLNKKEVKGLK